MKEYVSIINVFVFIHIWDQNVRIHLMNFHFIIINIQNI